MEWQHVLKCPRATGTSAACAWQLTGQFHFCNALRFLPCLCFDELSVWNAAEIIKMASAWMGAGEKGTTKEFQERLVRELSEPITQRILRSELNTEKNPLKNALLQFWPGADQHTMTNVLTAIMQVPSCD